MPVATCCRCKQSKSLIHFYKDSSRKNGHGTACKNCSNAYNRERKVRRALDGFCANCGKTPTDGARICERCLRTSYKLKCASRRGLEFSLTDVEFSSLVHSECSYCGKLPNPRNGIDRVENTKGYTLENCVSCCFICNRAKNDMSREEFIEWATRIKINAK